MDQKGAGVFGNMEKLDAGESSKNGERTGKMEWEARGKLSQCLREEDPGALRRPCPINIVCCEDAVLSL
ncbi:hypothetical protein BaRGS_00000854 [Batillaria attramentaria]|uniref:Uncharacterized protein n=1 Tax=Batillaria attramentaria TaxID=370345 RepID=A0ABD0M7E9_9CAEN